MQLLRDSILSEFDNQGNTGAMIAFLLPPSLAQHLYDAASTALGPLAQPVDNLHLTLVNFDEIPSQNDVDALKKYFEMTLPSIHALSCQITGIERFTTNSPNALVAKVQGEGLEKLNIILAQCSKDYGFTPSSDFEFNPHITLGYLSVDMAQPEISLSPLTFELNNVSFVEGDNVDTYPLTGEMELHDAEKFTKEEAAYTDKSPSLKEHCGSCEHFIQGGNCTLVQGTIDDEGWCRFYGPQAKVSEMISEFYKIRKTADKKFEVYNPENNHVFGTHPSRQKAVMQQRALYVNAPPEKEKVKEEAGDPNADGGIYDPLDPDHDADIDIPGYPDEDDLHGPSNDQDDEVGYEEGVASYPDLAIKDTPEQDGQQLDKVLHEIAIPAPSFKFQGTPPKIPFADGVNVAELTQKDRESGVQPFYILRPLGTINQVSKNGLIYDRQLLDTIHEQILSKHPPGRQGHVPDDEEDSAFPDLAGIWVGSAWEGNTLWGKAYIPPGTFREQLKLMKAAGSGIGNSIYGPGRMENVGQGKKRCTYLNIESIDFAPPERASLPTDPTIYTVSETRKKVKEMSEQVPQQVRDYIKGMKASELHEMLPEYKAHEMFKKHLGEMDGAEIYEDLNDDQKDDLASCHLPFMEPSEVYGALPGGHAKAISEYYAKEMNLPMSPGEGAQNAAGSPQNASESMPTTVADEEMAKEMTRLKEMDTQKEQRISSLEETIKEYRQKEYNNLVKETVDNFYSQWHVSTEAGVKVLTTLKETFHELLASRMNGKDVTELQKIAGEVWEGRMKEMSEAGKLKISGPSIFQTKEQGKAAGQGLATREDINSSRARTGF